MFTVASRNHWYDCKFVIIITVYIIFSKDKIDQYFVEGK